MVSATKTAARWHAEDDGRYQGVKGWPRKKRDGWTIAQAKKTAGCEGKTTARPTLPTLPSHQQPATHARAMPPRPKKQKPRLVPCHQNRCGVQRCMGNAWVRVGNDTRRDRGTPTKALSTSHRPLTTPKHGQPQAGLHTSLTRTKKTHNSVHDLHACVNTKPDAATAAGAWVDTASSHTEACTMGGELVVNHGSPVLSVRTAFMRCCWSLPPNRYSSPVLTRASSEWHSRDPGASASSTGSN
jgi:hypothetical protein